MTALVFQRGTRVVNPRGVFWSLVFFLALSCGQGCAPSSDLDQGIAFIRYMTGKGFIQESTFMMNSAKTPSKFVEWLLSDFGKAEWPGIKPTDINPNVPLKQKIDVMAPKRPETVAFVADTPDDSLGKQIVLRGDDAKNVLILSAYADPKQSPVMVVEIPFPAL
ncbi:MAG: hypothetical protein COV67_13915 [Nitrospinae bacterium CG11_big_fil_rev_8_21_14_0_20_56_8]|nr:MAG: hypothetical protein COV67_13915 [Nitrospinae bacterium CG11_big_fil_rev_8_21_14_0_20_56_8]